MKKFIGGLLTLVLLFTTMAFSALAADATFTDTLEDNDLLVYKKSDKIVYQYNTDMETSFYLKVDTVKTEEYLIYKMDGDITGFSIDTFHTNGLGTPEDVSVYLSNDEQSWVKADTKALDLYFNEEFYINYDMAYWLQSTVSNKSAIDSGYRYIKITLNPYTVDGSVAWNTALDTIKITYKSGDTPATSTTTTTTTTTAKKPSTDTTTTAANASVTSAVSSVETSESAPETTVRDLETTDATESFASSIATQADSDVTDSKGGAWIWIITAVVVIGGGAGAFFFLRKKKA